MPKSKRFQSIGFSDGDLSEQFKAEIKLFPFTDANAHSLLWLPVFLVCDDSGAIQDFMIHRYRGSIRVCKGRELVLMLTLAGNYIFSWILMQRFCILELFC
jgi:hypothetical protein